jgi:hypothetical protein
VKARLLLLLGWGFCTAALCKAEVSLQLPLARTAYQCNESVPLTVLRSGAQEQGGGELMLKLRATHGSSLMSTFTGTKPDSRSMEHLQVHGWLLRPGSYSVEVACNGATARTVHHETHSFI